MPYGIIGLLILILDIYAIIRILSRGMEPVMKLIWVIVVLVLPPIGAILYFVIGEKK